MIEGPPGVGKHDLAEQLSARLNASLILDDPHNPFLAEHRAGRPGAGFHAQLFFLLARHRQQLTLCQTDLFSQRTVADYLFDRDKIYAYLSLDDNELFIYQRLYDLLIRDVPAPDLVIYLQAPTDVLQRRIRERLRAEPETQAPGLDIGELNEAFNHFFFHYAASPLLVVETSAVDISWPQAVIDELLKQVDDLTHGTRFYVPRIT